MGWGVTPFAVLAPPGCHSASYCVRVARSFEVGFTVLGRTGGGGLNLPPQMPLGSAGQGQLRRELPSVPAAVAPPLTRFVGWETHNDREAVRCMELDRTFPEMVFHDLRRTAVTLNISTGANVKVVQQLAGHSSAKTTLDVYAQLVPEDAHDSARAVDALLRGDE